MAKVLLVGMAKKEETRLESFFKSVGVDCMKVATIDSALERIPSDPPTLVLAERPEAIEALHSLQSVLKASAPATPFLVTLQKPAMTTAVDVMKAGAFDCLARPFVRFDVLVAAKRATIANGRTLFSAKIDKERRRWDLIFISMLLSALVLSGVRNRYNGPPDPVLNLGSATLSGIQWDDRDLWVGNWVDSTVTQYHLKRSLISSHRVLDTAAIYRMQDSQPILVCNTPNALITVGFDLKMRSHQTGVGLPTLQTLPTPGNNPTGLAWDGQYLWSIDGQTGLLYKHGPDLRVLETIPSIIPNPVGLAWDGVSLWILGGPPFNVARLERYGFGNVWRGPYSVANAMPETMMPSGVTVGFGRLWMVSGGDPRMTSRPLTEIMEPKNQRWKK